MKFNCITCAGDFDDIDIAQLNKIQQKQDGGSLICICKSCAADVNAFFAMRERHQKLNVVQIKPKPKFTVIK